MLSHCSHYWISCFNHRTIEAWYYRDIFWAEILCSHCRVSKEMAKIAPSSCVFPPALNGSALNRGKGRTSARIISSHRRTRKQLQQFLQAASSPGNGHKLQTPPSQKKKNKKLCHHPGFREIPESLSFIIKIIYERKQMWSTNRAINWKGRWSFCGLDSNEPALWKTKHPRWPRPSISVAPTGRLVLGLEATKLKQKSPLLPQQDTQTG